jgi:hypothetical protein
MNTARLLSQLATELPALARQAASDDVALRSACVMRLNELSSILAPYRTSVRHHTSRRAVRSLSLSKGKAGLGATFAAWAIKMDD